MKKYSFLFLFVSLIFTVVLHSQTKQNSKQEFSTDAKNTGNQPQSKYDQNNSSYDPKKAKFYSDSYVGWDGHFADAKCVVYNPSGTFLASGGNDGAIKLWNTSTGEQVRALLGHTSTVTSISISSNGNYLASGSDDKSIRLWDTNSGQLINSFSLSGSSNNTVVFSPDNKILATTGNDGIIRIWEIATGKILYIFSSGSVLFQSLSFSPNGEMLAAACGDYTIKIWNLQNGSIIKILNGHTSRTNSLKFSSDGSKIVSGGNDNTVRIWDVATGTNINILTGHTSSVTSVSFTPNNSSIVSAGEERSIKIWNALSGSLVQSINGITSSITSFDISPDGSKIVSSSLDGVLRIWDIVSGSLLKSISAHTSEMTGVTLSPDGNKIVTGALDAKVKVWDFNSELLLNTLIGHGINISGLDYSPDGKIIASGSGDASVRLWDANTGLSKNVLLSHSSSVYGIKFSPDGSMLASGSNDQTIKIWNVTNGTLLKTLNYFGGSVYTVSFSPDNRFLATAGQNGVLNIWDVTSGAQLKNLVRHSNAIQAIDYSPDGSKIASGAWDSRIIIWNAGTGGILHNIIAHTGCVTCVCYSRDGSKLISSGLDNTIRVWDASSMSLIKTMNYDHGFAWRIALHPEFNKIIAAGWGYKNIRIYDLELSTLQAPSLFSPQNNAFDISKSITFTWSAISGASSYVLQISGDSTFNTIITNHTGLTTTSYSVVLSGGKKYFWRVKAVGNSAISNWSEAWSFSTQNHLPSVPVLLSPTNSASGIKTDTLLQWSASINADYYHFQTSNSASFSSVIKDQSNIVGTNLLVTNLSKSTTYYWRVRAYNSEGYSNWSDIFSFSTINALQTPLLNLPSHNSSLIPLNPILSWNAVPGATSYCLQISTSENFAVVKYNLENITTTSSLITNLDRNSGYFWKVKASGSGSESNWSEPWYFTTIGNTPDRPVLKVPLNYSSINVNYLQNGLNLQWEMANNASSYSIQIAGNLSFDPIIIEKSGLLTTSYNFQDVKNQSYYWRVRAANANGLSDWSDTWVFTPTVVGIDKSDNLPSCYNLGQNYPNPFNPSTKIEYSVPDNSKVELTVFDTFGRIVDVLVNRHHSPGNYIFTWEPKSLPSGVYYYQLKAGKFSDVKKMTYVR